MWGHFTRWWVSRFHPVYRPTAHELAFNRFMLENRHKRWVQNALDNGWTVIKVEGTGNTPVTTLRKGKYLAVINHEGGLHTDIYDVETQGSLIINGPHFDLFNDEAALKVELARDFGGTEYGF